MADILGFSVFIISTFLIWSWAVRRNFKNVKIDFTDTFSEHGYDEPIEDNYKPPINQFTESVNELGLSLSKDLTEKIVNEAYLKCVTKYQKFLQDKVEPEFMISVKETAWEYLINFLRFRIK
jgi:hypothetical protein